MMMVFRKHLLAALPLRFSLSLCLGWQIHFGGKHGATFQLAATPSVQEEVAGASLVPFHQRRKPFEQRTKGPRPARRLNHAFKYLYRHDRPMNLTEDAMEFFLEQGYTQDQVWTMNASFPPLLTLSVTRHLYPKMRFLNETLQANREDRWKIAPQYFGARLERTLAPRHAFLQYTGLPHGRQLFDKDLFTDFLIACRTAKRFAALCRTWQRRYQRTAPTITAQQVEAFDALFSRGLMAAARNELVQANNTWPLDYMDLDAAALVRLLLAHGAHPLERDHRGVTLLHWAAGTGNRAVVDVLLEHHSVWTRTERDGATPLHWAVAGANSREFGTGGHVDICRHLLQQVEPSCVKDYVNQQTFDGNSPLMWAAWSGTLATVKLLVRARAAVETTNRNGCSVAHWAASGGNVDVCRYLASVANVDFTAANYGGNTPLTHAVAFGHADVVQWLCERIDDGPDTGALELANDFVHWTDGDERRRQVLLQFQEWYDYERESDGSMERGQMEEDPVSG